MKNSADQGGCYPQRLKAEVDNTLLFIQSISSLLRLLQTFAGVLQKKIRTRAVFKETSTNYISKERL